MFAKVSVVKVIDEPEWTSTEASPGRNINAEWRQFSREEEVSRIK